MSVTQRPPIPSLIPESAPFTLEQRTWLNGLFAGLFGLPENVTPVSSADATKPLAGLFDGAAGATAPQNEAVEADDGAPWHDPAMPMPDRMKLADGKPLPGIAVRLRPASSSHSDADWAIPAFESVIRDCRGDYRSLRSCAALATPAAAAG